MKDFIKSKTFHFIKGVVVIFLFFMAITLFFVESRVDKIENLKIGECQIIKTARFTKSIINNPNYILQPWGNDYTKICRNK